MSRELERSASINETGRVEAFSDGVLAIVITLLVLELQVPRDLPPGASLAAELSHEWPSYLAFLTSFATIGIMWVNHHRLFNLIGRATHGLLMLNLLLLLSICVVPFPTAVVAEHIADEGARTAALMLNITFFLVAVFYNLLWRYAASGRRLIADHVPSSVVDAQTRQYRWGPIIYFVAVLLALVSPLASVALNLALAIFFALPLRVGQETGFTSA